MGRKSGSLLEEGAKRGPGFLVEQESGRWLEVLVFGGRSFCGDLRRSESVLEGSPRSEKWAGPGTLQVSYLQAGGAGRLHSYTGTPGLGLQAGAVMRRVDGWWEGRHRAVPWGCACCVQHHQGLSSGFWGGCSTGEGWFGLSHARAHESSCVPPQALWLLQLTIFFLLQLPGPLSCVCN